MDDAREPLFEFLLDEVDLLDGVEAPDFDGFALGVRSPRGVHDVDDGVRVRQLVEELIAEAAALVRAGDESGYVDEFDGDVTDAVLAVAAALVAVEAGTAGASVRDAAVRVDGREGVVRHVDLGERRGRVERRFAGVRLAG